MEEETSYELQRDELFETLKQIMIENFQLVEKFHTYCDQYIEYQSDVQGLNDDEAADSLRKIAILKNKIIEKIRESIDCEIVQPQLVAETYTIKFSCTKDMHSFQIIFQASQKSFDLEIV